MDGDGLREDGVAEGGAAEVVDAELHAGDAAVPRRHVRAHARQRLRHQRRHAAVQHLERLDRIMSARSACGRGDVSLLVKLARREEELGALTWQQMGVTGRRPVSRDGESSSISNPRACSGASSSAIMALESAAAGEAGCCWRCRDPTVASSSMARPAAGCRARGSWAGAGSWGKFVRGTTGIGRWKEGLHSRSRFGICLADQAIWIGSGR